MRYRRFAQYRLITLFAVVSACSAVCLWLQYFVDRARKQAAAIASVEHWGGTVYFDATAPSRFQNCMRCVLGKDYAGAVEGVAIYPNEWLFQQKILRQSLSGPAVTTNRPPFRDVDLAILSNFYALKHLNLARTHLTDRGLLEISKIRTLRNLNLSRTEIGDDGLLEISNLGSLEVLNVAGTHISDRGLVRFGGLTNLKELTLSSTDVGDSGVSFLVKLRELKVLSIQNTNVSEAGVAEIQRTLPNCDVWR